MQDRNRFGINKRLQYIIGPSVELVTAVWHYITPPRPPPPAPFAPARPPCPPPACARATAARPSPARETGEGRRGAERGCVREYERERERECVCARVCALSATSTAAPVRECDKAQPP